MSYKSKIFLKDLESLFPVIKEKKKAVLKAVRFVQPRTSVK